LTCILRLQGYITYEVRNTRFIVTECMRKVLKIPREVVAVEPHPGRPGNAWLILENGLRGEKSGFYLEILRHLITCERCRKAQLVGELTDERLKSIIADEFNTIDRLLRRIRGY